MSDQQAPAGWYPVDGGQERFWDGGTWTDQIRDAVAASPKQRAKSSGLKGVASAAASRLTSNDHDVPEGTLWSALGKGVGGITTGRYRLDIHFLYFSKGTLRTDSQQIPIADVLDVDVRQSMTQKARGVCSVVVHVRRGAGTEIVTMEDIPDGATAQQTINQVARDARLMLEHRSIQIDGLRHQATNTVRQEISYQGGQPPMVPGQVPGLLPGAQIPALTAAQAPADTVDAVEIVPVADDPIEQITKLASLRDAGILTEEEFTAKKAEILSRM